MRNILIVLFCMIFPLATFGQISYESGYFINNAGVRTACLIKNLDWEVSPKEVKYKLSEDGEVQKFSTVDCAEFGISNNIKYICRQVDIDQTPINYQTPVEIKDPVAYQRNPVYKSDKVFLRLLVDGKASLYDYSMVNQHQFFYSKEGSELKPLVYKKFFMLSENLAVPGVKNNASNYHVHENNYFQSQLYKELNCNNASPTSYNKMPYKRKDLIKYFISYNGCARK